MFSIQFIKMNGSDKNSKDVISACHDNQADNYDERLFRDVKDPCNYIRENYFSVHDEVLKSADLKEGDKLLDIGIGTGLLEEKIKVDLKIYGIDVSEKMMSKIRNKKLNIADLRTGSFNFIPYDDNMFDVIVSCFAFHHLSDNDKINSVTEMKRVLKNNGRIVIGDFMFLNENEKKILIKKFQNEGRADMAEELEDENFTNIENFKRQLENNNFITDYKRISTISWVIIGRLNS